MQGYSYINLLRKILKIKKKVLVDKSYAEIFKYFLKMQYSVLCSSSIVQNTFLFTK